MRLICQRAFGNLKPGETVEVPDGAEFDGFYFLKDEDEEGQDKEGNGE